MSIDALQWAKRQTVGGCGRKAVLNALADRADEEWSCYPGQDLLAAETEQSVRAVHDHLKALEAQGKLRRVKRYRNDGTRTSDRYQLLPNGLPADSASGDYRQLSPSLPATVSITTGNSCRAEPKEEPKEEPTATSLNPTPSSHDQVTADFDAFWERYPRRVGKGQALKAYRAARKKTTAETILKAVTRYPFDRERPQFIPHPSTWLNGERWSDELPTLVGPSGRPQPTLPEPAKVYQDENGVWTRSWK